MGHTEGIATAGHFGFLILVYWYDDYYLFVNRYFVFYACSVTCLFLVTELEYIHILINSYRGTILYVVRLPFPFALDIAIEYLILMNESI